MMQDTNKADAVAQRRFELLAPLLDPCLDRGKFRALKQRLAEDTGLSERTIRRYLNEYQKMGLDGLKTKSRGRCPGQTVPENVLAEAILLRREVPSRSVAQIIDILEDEGLVPHGVLKRSTLQDYFQTQGYSSRQMRLYESVSGRATRRFQRRRRCDLWQSDIKYASYLPSGKGGKKQQCYLVTFLDDATRFVVHAELYDTLDQWIVEDAFRSAIIKWGAPAAVYFDNGKQYRNAWMKDCCQRLGIRLLYAKPYSACSKGKVEKFNCFVNNFLAEERINKAKSLAHLNEMFADWLNAFYQNKEHSALGDGISPQMAFQRDNTALRFVEQDKLSAAFLHHAWRKVDKAGCISLDGKKYDVGWRALGKKVQVTYDPKERTEISVSWNNEIWSAQELKIGERCASKPKALEAIAPIAASESRVLKAAARKRQAQVAAKKHAISFSAIEEA
jgi:transposase InsO family protein